VDGFANRIGCLAEIEVEHAVSVGNHGLEPSGFRLVQGLFAAGTLVTCVKARKLNRCVHLVHHENRRACPGTCNQM
jgi:hypothetical protein